MYELFRQRFSSKTFRAALIAAILTIIEINSGFISQFIPVAYRSYIVLAWPVLMLVLREFTTTALSEK